MGHVLENAAMQIPVFLFAIVIHEWGHAWMAKVFGDDTAERQGRLTLNPMAHIDPMGTVFFPLLLLFIGSTVFGWAKPVPVSVRNLKDPRRGLFWVSFAGPGMNLAAGILSALVLAVIVHFSSGLDESGGYSITIIKMLKFSVIINFILAFFNLIPLHPLDGSKMLPRFLNYEWMRKYERFCQHGQMILMGLVLLSFVGLPVFNILLYPAFFLADYLPRLFLGIIG
ncbi:MAG: site-2 protease family protein [Bacteriovoracales bacterium]|nr:site-2 protease family protein [Bacteriovoracales bacterium]